MRLICIKNVPRQDGWHGECFHFPNHFSLLAVTCQDSPSATRLLAPSMCSKRGESFVPSCETTRGDIQCTPLGQVHRVSTVILQCPKNSGVSVGGRLDRILLSQGCCPGMLPRDQTAGPEMDPHALAGDDGVVSLEPVYSEQYGSIRGHFLFNNTRENGANLGPGEDDVEGGFAKDLEGSVTDAKCPRTVGEISRGSLWDFPTIRIWALESRKQCTGMELFIARKINVSCSLVSLPMSAEHKDPNGSIRSDKRKSEYINRAPLVLQRQ